MHNIALALQKEGHDVTGSDDQIFEPSRSRLDKAGLLPRQEGWNADRITSDIELIILGMHARDDNPELKRAMELGLQVVSFPEYIAMRSKDKQRLVVAGSHGKTSTTAMIMHVLKQKGIDFDYLVGSQLRGFDLMVKLSDAPLIVIEGDEYLSSALDRRPKFLWYEPQIAIVTGIAWDHINVFPTFEEYLEQFRLFERSMPPEGKLIYFDEDIEMEKIAASVTDRTFVPYAGLESYPSGVRFEAKEYPMRLFGSHNFQNMHAAVLALKELGISIEESLRELAPFEGTARRLELIHESSEARVYRDFAHAPSKVKATVTAVREGFPDHRIVAALELHTFSSLNKDFLPQYAGSMDEADDAFVYFSPKVLEAKRLEMFSVGDVENAFGNIQAFDTPDALSDAIRSSVAPDQKTLYLMMSSGTFGGVDILRELSLD